MPEGLAQQIPAPQPEQGSPQGAEGRSSPAQSPANPTTRKPPRHAIAGVERPKPVSNEINRADLF